jgi:hypothetical protein
MTLVLFGITAAYLFLNATGRSIRLGLSRPPHGLA